MQKIKMVVFYQSVKVDNALEKSFTPDNYKSDARIKKGHSAEVMSNGVLLRGKTNDVLVPFNNVAYIEFEKEAETSEPAKASKTK